MVPKVELSGARLRATAGATGYVSSRGFLPYRCLYRRRHLTKISFLSLSLASLQRTISEIDR
jgi:hypothetical protein